VSRVYRTGHHRNISFGNFCIGSAPPGNGSYITLRHSASHGTLLFRLISHASELLALDRPIVLAGDYNVMLTDLYVYTPERWVDDALFRPEVGMPGMARTSV
jgi:exonuclease III